MHRAKIVRSTGETVYVEAEKRELVEEQVMEGDTMEFVDEIADLLESNPVYQQAMCRTRKEKAVQEIKVNVADKIFDGDEISQGRMLRAIQIAAVTGETATKWKLADNSVADVTLDELKEALSLEGKESSKIWVVG